MTHILLIMKTIHIRGARTHNLKNITLDLPRDQLIVITGLSGSGKSSLAFDTLYAEGQRRYVESLSAYARQFLSMMQKPDVDHIEGLSPAISIEQKATSRNPRSTVGTITEIYDYLRLLYARIGHPYCPEHHTVLAAQTISQMVDAVLALPLDSKLMILAPVIQDRKGEHLQLLENFQRQGFVRARIDGTVYELDEIPSLSARQKHTIEIVIDRFKVGPQMEQRLAESFETALRLAHGLTRVAPIEGGSTLPELVFSSQYACTACGYSLSELEPRLFSFNNPAGACPSCNGLGVTELVDPLKVVKAPQLSLLEGAIPLWTENADFSILAEGLAHHYDFDLKTPFCYLPQKVQHKILYGSSDELIPFSYQDTEGRRVKQKTVFDGILPLIKRRYENAPTPKIKEKFALYFSHDSCPECQGTRLKKEAQHVYINEKNLPHLTSLSIEHVFTFFETLSLTGLEKEIATGIIKEIKDRLHFLKCVGLDYLTLDRASETLSGGEAQRIRLASQIGSGLMGVMYILDEPSIGLHQRDNDRLLDTLKQLRDLGNTVIVVEHDEDAIRHADYIVDMGPGAGVHGGKVVAQGTLAHILETPESLTGQYLSKSLEIPVPTQRIPVDPKRLIRITQAQCNNLKNITVTIPVGLFTCVTGVSGSGKSSLINDTLLPIALREINGEKTLPSSSHCSKINGLAHFDKVVNIDQSPIGRTPRSNPATYTGLFSPVRELFAHTQESRARGYSPGRFSFNVKGGRCEACEGDGVIKVEMHFLADVYVTCDICQGKRYNRETLDIKYKGKNIYEVLEMTVEEAYEFFKAVPLIARKLATLISVGLSYMAIGQSATTLSGGEAQRIKLSRELARRDTGNTLYILDEPTTGLHFHDVNQLLAVLHQLRDQGNTLVVIEHNLDVIKTADWIIDLGPKGGEAGGYVMATGTPEEIARHPDSETGRYLITQLQHSLELDQSNGERSQNVKYDEHLE